MGGYVRGSVINGLIVGLLTFIGLLIIGVDTPLVLGIFAGILEFIPILGPFIAGVLIVLTALLQSPLLALLAAFYVLVMQQMESNILVPYIMRRQTELSPLLALLAVFFGGVAGGLVGVLAAVPAAAALQVILVSLAAPAARRLKEPR
jgi:predicted PurR-regulated permease PerM